MRCFLPLAGTMLILAQTAGLKLPAANAQNAAAGPPAHAPVGRWRLADSMHERREYAGGVRLNDGRILAVSGHPLDGKSIASAELYDPATGKWNNTGSLRQARNSGNEATLLHDGRVLLAGGISGTAAIRGCELFDPTTGQWSDAASLSVGRDAKVTLLADGRVLASGGIDWSIDGGKAYAVSEIYDPKSGEWTTTGSLRTARYAHRTILLGDGRVLAVGGYQQGDVLLASAEVYDPQTGLWQPTGDLSSPRVAFGLTRLRDGRVLVAGGFTGVTWQKRANVASAALYDAKSARWQETKPMQDQRAGLSITELPDGQVLVAGGWSSKGLEFKSAELFDPGTETWRPVASMIVARRNHRTALLPDGSVLIMGGSSFLGGSYLSSCEIFSY
ncbi:MAG: Kelch repeat-containing protein [Pirellulales bacterium]